MRSGRERTHARERGLAHARNPGVTESPRRPLTIQRGEIVRAPCASVGLCVHVRERFPKKSWAEKPSWRRSEGARVELGTVRARAHVISEKIVRLQAQLSEHTKERELRLALHGPIDEKGRPRKSRACELTLRSPDRPWPPASKRSLPEKVQVVRLVPRLVLFEKS